METYSLISTQLASNMDDGVKRIGKKNAETDFKFMDQTMAQTKDVDDVVHAQG